MTSARRLPILLLAISVGGCWPGERPEVLNGYVEADLVHVAAEETARLVALEVQRGDRVDAGASLFRLDATDAKAAEAEARARLSQAQAQLADLKTGKRPEEIAVIEAQRDQVLANLAAARRDFERRNRLHTVRVVSDANIDETEARYEELKAQLARMEHELKVARLPGRPQVIAAAEAAVEASRATLDQINARLDRLTGEAPAAARVEDTFFEPGETVPAGGAVVSLLPPGALKVRFFVPEPTLARVAVGDRLTVDCDGCEEPVTATVSFVAREAEFTPPVIYSVEARDKLVYMVEAVPDDVSKLKVGQPVDVTLSGHS